jgi:hypothetical protein
MPILFIIESAQPLKKEQPTLITINKLKLLVVMMAKSSFLMAKLPMFPWYLMVKEVLHDR